MLYQSRYPLMPEKYSSRSTNRLNLSSLSFCNHQAKTWLREEENAVDSAGDSVAEEAVVVTVAEAVVVLAAVTPKKRNGSPSPSSAVS
ncbi:hypothetical protein L1987_77513 [Smallanthus sonchifolius]|uniref:Uncharacterized protein n=1 Tax=Smallanthus sonchifolius TaxID=185202 RepID=A0ACB8ZAL5_9ASTR|nr:hypothetical protein L1987_77513 [Smallanthus sonchifolius]